MIDTGYDVVWQPIPGSSQELALDTRCHHTLYCGTRGPGKSITQLMRFRRRVGLGYGSYWRGIIIDREFKDLSDLVVQSQRFFTAFNDGCKFLSSAVDYKWIWPTGEQLLFRHMKRLSDYNAIHGHEYPFIGWNELTKYPNLDLYDKVMSTNRSSFDPEMHTSVESIGKKTMYVTPDRKPLPPIPLEVFSTTNPSGPGHHAVKRRFISIAPYGQVVKTDVKVFDPKSQKDITVTKTQVAIFGSYRENKFLSAEYIAELDLTTRSNPNLAKAWLQGSWDVTAGGALDDLWSKDVHVIPRFRVPNHWRVDRSFDWGSSHPFSVIWWCECNGEEALLPNGKLFCPPVGTLIAIADWYGSKVIGSNKGIALSSTDIARGIVKIEASLLADKWISGKVYAGPADNQINDTRETDVDTIASKMAKVGVRWERSDKSPGSRKIGLSLIRERLDAVVRHYDIPRLYVMQNCVNVIDLLPTVPRDLVNIEDVDTSSEDHIYDAVRYRVLAGSSKAPKNAKFSQPV